MAQSCTVLVIGAGPVGLAAAAFFAKEGHQVRVLERSSSLNTASSGGVAIQPAATKCLQGLGDATMKAVEATSITSTSLTWWSYKENTPLSVFPYPEVSTTPRYQLERRRLTKILSETATGFGAELLFDKKVTKLEEGHEEVTVWTDAGEEFKADLIVGADGITSTTRQLIFPNESTYPITSTERIFVTSVPHSVLSTDSRVQNAIDPYTVQLTLGPGRYVIFAGLTDKRLGATFVVDKYGGDDAKPPAEADGTWEQTVDVTELRELFKDFNEPTRAYLEHVESVISYPTAKGAKLSSWRSDGGRAILIGNAAHAMDPYATQGLSLGLEDAAALARAVSLAPDMDEALTTYEEKRRPRIERFTSVTEVAGAKEFNTLPDGEEQKGRDQALRMMHNVRLRMNWKRIKPFMKATPRSPGYDKWEQDWDVVDEIEKVFEEGDDDDDPGYDY